jgi:integrase
VRGSKDAHDPFVFTLEDGRPMHPERVMKVFYEAADAAGLPRIRLHDLRHTAATLALQAGVPISVVSRWLGHKSTQMTFDVYSHVVPEMHDDSVDRVEATL